MSGKRHVHELKLATHDAHRPWICDVCLTQGDGQSRQCATCDYDECLVCWADHTRQITAPTSLRAVLEAQVQMSEAAEAEMTASHTTDAAETTEEDEEKGLGEPTTGDRVLAAAATFVRIHGVPETLLSGAAERCMGRGPDDCLLATRKVAAQLLIQELGTELAELVALFAPWQGTEDLPLRFARLTDAEASENGWAAVAVDEWRDRVYAARGGQIRVYDALGHGGSLFVGKTRFVAPIVALAIAPGFPNPILCVVDGA